MANNNTNYSSSPNHREDLFRILDEAQDLTNFIMQDAATLKNKRQQRLTADTNTTAMTTAKTTTTRVTPPSTTSSNSSNNNSTAPVLDVALKKPLRPLSAYNIFFQLQRDRIVQAATSAPQSTTTTTTTTCGEQQQLLLSSSVAFTKEEVERVIQQRNQNSVSPQSKRKHVKTHGKIGFAQLARMIGQDWKNLDPEQKAMFEACAEKERVRHKRKMAEFNQQKNKQMGCSSSSSTTGEQSSTTSFCSSTTAAPFQTGSIKRSVSNASEELKVENVCSNNNNKGNDKLGSADSMSCQPTSLVAQLLSGYDYMESQHQEEEVDEEEQDPLFPNDDLDPIPINDISSLQQQQQPQEELSIHEACSAANEAYELCNTATLEMMGFQQQQQQQQMQLYTPYAPQYGRLPQVKSSRNQMMMMMMMQQKQRQYMRLQRQQHMRLRMMRLQQQRQQQQQEEEEAMMLMMMNNNHAANDMLLASPTTDPLEFTRSANAYVDHVLEDFENDTMHYEDVDPLHQSMNQNRI